MVPTLRAGRRLKREVAWPRALVGLAFFGMPAGCDARPDTNVVLENHYAASSTFAAPIYQAKWQAVFFTNPIAPGAASDPQPTAPASGNTAYVLLAPGWDSSGSAPPSSLVLLRSRGQYAVHLNDTLRIAVDDATFIGNCAAGDPLMQSEADFISGLVFPGAFPSQRYDAATCTTILLGDAGSL